MVALAIVAVDTTTFHLPATLTEWLRKRMAA
jgi:hypothetical protein